jgi:4-oxalocrotonate tautomerase
MPLINVKAVEGIFSAEQKEELIRKLTDVVVAVEGEAIRSATVVIIEEVKSGDWGIGGTPMTQDAILARVRGERR